MNAPRTSEATRLPTGVRGLDRILGGGLVRDAIYIVSGRPGAGKTILSNQISMAHAREGGRVVYATLLAETHARLIAQMRTLSFFDDALVGGSLHYLNALDAMTERGLDGLLELVRSMVRDHDATLLVLDGMLTAERLAKSDDEYKRFISTLQTWVGVVGCTVIFVTSSGMGSSISPEHTMVDGIIELTADLYRMRSLRHVAVTKLRGSAFLEGRHTYLITDDGLAVYPRMEAQLAPDGAPVAGPRASIGVPGLDAVLGGGIVRQSTTLLLGASGAGKTVMGLQYLAEGALRGERCLHFGFYEPPRSLISKADRLGLDFTGLIERGNMFVQWFRPAEIQIDALVDRMLTTVREQRIERLFIDGFVGFRSSHVNERISSVFAAVSDELAGLGVTTLISDETRELFVREIEVPTPNVSAIFHNIIFVRQVEVGAELKRLLGVMKTRDSAADRRLWEYEIGDRGIALVAPFAAVDVNLMGGTARVGAAPPRAKTKKSSKKPPPPPARRRGK